jgi:hypothetical protein
VVRNGTTKKRGVPWPCGRGSERQPTKSASPLQSNEALRANDSNEPGSCYLKSQLVVEGNDSACKTENVKALRPMFQATGETGSSPERTALDVLNLRVARALPLPRQSRRQHGSLENSLEALRDFGCRTRLRPARAKESGGEEKPLPSGRGGLTVLNTQTPLQRCIESAARCRPPHGGAHRSDRDKADPTDVYPIKGDPAGLRLVAWGQGRRTIFGFRKSSLADRAG